MIFMIAVQNHKEKENVEKIIFLIFLWFNHKHTLF